MLYGGGNIFSRTLHFIHFVIVKELAIAREFFFCIMELIFSLTNFFGFEVVASIFEFLPRFFDFYFH